MTEFDRIERLYFYAERAFERGRLTEAALRQIEDRYHQAKAEQDAAEWQWMADALDYFDSTQVDGAAAAKLDFVYGATWTDALSGRTEARESPTHFASIKGNLEQGQGLTAHRGVLQEGEYVDPKVMAEAIWQRFQVDAEDISAVFGPGRLSAQDQKLRAWLEDAFLRIQDRGGNMAQFAKVLGWEVRADGYSRRMSQALSRAKKRRNS
jgi:hypothetical protein